MKPNTVFFKVLIILLFVPIEAFSQEPSFSRGLAKEIHSGLFDCGSRGRISAVGSIVSEDGKEWIVPASTHFLTAPKATDLYNTCTGTIINKLSELKITSIPLFDAAGNEEFLAYIFSDNYFEIYVNGKLLAVDPVPFTPFNSNVVRFKAERPVTIAILMVDWEENLGLGSENGRGYAFHPGDGGLVAHIKDNSGKTVALSDKSWRVQTTYIAPLKDQNCLKVDDQIRDSSACDTTGVADGTGFYAAHWEVPPDWMIAGFDDSAWPSATTFSNKTVGIDNKRAFTNFRELFDTPGADAEFIWSSNLILDNAVLLRKTFE